MSEYKYASWVKGEYLLWAKDNPKIKFCPKKEAIKKALKREQRDDVRKELEKALNKPPKLPTIATFLQNGYSEPYLETLREIAKAEPTAKNINLEASPGYIGYRALEITDTLLNQLEGLLLDYDINYKKINKDHISTELDQFRRIIKKLHNALHATHIFKASDLIDGAPDILVTDTNLERMCNEKKALTIALRSFWDKTALHVLLEFADKIESLTSGNPYYVVNNRPPTITQARIQEAVNFIIDLIGVSATQRLTGLPDLIVHLIDLINKNGNQEEHAKLCPKDVSPKIKSYIKKYESLNKN